MKVIVDVLWEVGKIHLSAASFEFEPDEIVFESVISELVKSISKIKPYVSHRLKLSSALALAPRKARWDA